MRRVRRLSAVLVAVFLVATAEAGLASDTGEPDVEPVAGGAGGGSAALAEFSQRTGRRVTYAAVIVEVVPEGTALWAYQERHRCRSLRAAKRLVRDPYGGARGCRTAWFRWGQTTSDEATGHVPLHELKVSTNVPMKMRRPGRGPAQRTTVPVSVAWTGKGDISPDPWFSAFADPCGADAFAVATAYRRADSRLAIAGQRHGAADFAEMIAGAGLGAAVWPCMVDLPSPG